MNKGQLINLKKILEENILEEYIEEYISIIRCGRYYLFETIQNKLELEEKLNTKKAVNIIITNFENAIRYYCKEHKEFDTMTLSPFICPYVKKKSLCKFVSNDDFCEIETILNNDIEILDDIVRINFFRLNVFNKNEKLSSIGDTTFIPNYNFNDWFIVSLKELNTKLLELGLELKNANNIKDLLNIYLKKEITINFEKDQHIIKILQKH